MGSHDQQFSDLFMLVIGVLVGIALGIFVIAQYIAGNTQDQYITEDEEYQQEVLARIAPIGQVVVAGEETAEEAATPVAMPEPVAVAMTGPQVYNAACVTCHGAGIGGAPVPGDPAIWSARIDQGMEALTDHVINGYQGDAGYMPPKGGRVDLSDDEIIAAMNYMIEESS